LNTKKLNFGRRLTQISRILNGINETESRIGYFVKKQGVINWQYREEIFDRITG